MSEKIKQIIASEMGLASVDERTTFESIDSLEFTDLMLALEKHGFKVEDANWRFLNNVGDVIRYAVQIC